MTDKMFLSSDKKSLHRGRRRVERTETCRPCRVWPKDAPELALQGVIINVTPFGMCIRMLEGLAVGTEVVIQMMRDETFAEPLASPVEGMIVRAVDDPQGFMDHGVQLLLENLQRQESRPVRPEKKGALPRHKTTRMHTIDFRVGGPGQRRWEK